MYIVMKMTYEYLPKEDIYILTGELPEGVDGLCKCVGCYNYAVVNATLDAEGRRKAAKHEINHIKNGDLFKDFDELSVL